MSNDPNKNQDTASTIVGVAMLGLIAVGILGLVSTFLHRDGTGLLASALAFGMIGWWAQK